MRLVTALTIATLGALGIVGSAGAMTLGQVTEFPLPTAASQPQAIVAGPDGNLWFTEYAADQIGEINPITHAITEYPVPTASAGPLGIATGPDGNIWFTEFRANQIGELNPATGGITEYPITSMPNSKPESIVAGANGLVWFTEFGGNAIASIETVAPNTITGYETGAGPFGITVGPDGNIWFTEQTAGEIGMLNPTTAVLRPDVVTLAASSQPSGIATGPDDSLWFTEPSHGAVGEFSPASPTTVTPIALLGESPQVITAGPDGNMWLTDPHGMFPEIYEIDSGTDQVIHEFLLTAAVTPIGLAAGEDGNMWYTDAAADSIGVVGTAQPATSATVPQITGTAAPGSTVTCTGATWSTWNDLQPALTANVFDGYAWFANGTAISGATSQTYVPAAGNVGEQLTCRVTATYGLPDTTGVATSAPVTVGSPPVSTAPPTVSGTAVAGKTLTESHATWSGVPTAFGYQWQLCSAAGTGCAAIAGATGQTYTLPKADAGQSVVVVETAGNAYGLGAPASSRVTAVAALPTSSLARVATNAAAPTVSVNCAGAAGQTCTGTYTVTAKERLQSGSIVAVAAAAKQKPKPKITSKTVTIASGSYKVASAKTTAVAIRVNATGRKLLTQFYKVPATLKLTGTTTRTKAVTLSYGRITATVAYAWAYGPESSAVRTLAITGIPIKGVVDAFCSGGGCPFAKRQFNPKHRAVSLTQAFSASHLSPGATLEIEISAPGDVAKVVEFTIAGGRRPAVRELCQPPGDRRPARCL